MTSKIDVYPKIIVYCPKENSEINGNKCLNCQFFNGVSINDVNIAQGESFLFFRCFFKKSGQGENDNEKKN